MNISEKSTAGIHFIEFYNVFGKFEDIVSIYVTDRESPEIFGS